MIKAYNEQTNTLEIKDKYNNHYRFALRGKKNIIKGNSGTGKTYLVNLIDMIKRKKLQSEYNVDNIEIIDESNVKKIRTFKNRMLIIDRAEFILSDDDIFYINSETSNNYLLFSRAPLGIDASPNHQADLVTQDNVTTLQYRFNIGRA